MRIIKNKTLTYKLKRSKSNIFHYRKFTNIVDFRYNIKLNKKTYSNNLSENLHFHE